MARQLLDYLVRCFIILFCINLVACNTAQEYSCVNENKNYTQRTDVSAFIQKMVDKYGFDKSKLYQLFNQVKTEPTILTTMSKPGEAKPWYQYRAMFLQLQRAQQGAAYWHQHEATLAAAQKLYGVDPAIIVAILGVETHYGKIQGNFLVLNALSTLGFNYPQRCRYFRGELEQYLLLTRDTPLDPLTVKGSYAGAMGAPQFMPSSYREYGVDVNHKGYADLMNNADDIIFSTAHYFKAYGWQTGQPVAVQARAVSDSYQKLLTNPLAIFTLAQLESYGVYPVSSSPLFNKNTQVSLLRLEGEHNPEFWIIFHNFGVITKYNASARYAMAAYQLSKWIKTLHQK